MKIHACGHELDFGEYLHTGAEITIEDNVWIGAGAYLLQGVLIGERASVAPSSIVSKSVSEHIVLAGVPAKKIRKLDW